MTRPPRTALSWRGEQVLSLGYPAPGWAFGRVVRVSSIGSMVLETTGNVG